MQWQRYRRGAGSTAAGDIWTGVFAVGGAGRRVDVYVPPGADMMPRPLLLLMDGQNVFDAARSHAGEWRADKILEGRGESPASPVVVAVDNGGVLRIKEYSPWCGRHGGGGANAFLQFLAREVLPAVRARFPVHATRESTGIGGSSMGGLFTAYALSEMPDLFGLGLIMSPSVWYADRALLGHVEKQPIRADRLYLDVGAAEGASTVAGAAELHARIASRGGAANVRFICESGAGHNEAAWSGRLPGAVDFLFGHSGAD
jgi:predicted alpha/beta superfamily hydrolase